MLDRALSRRVTVISAPPGSGKTSLMRAWADRPTNDRRVAFVSVERDQHDAQRFWSGVLEAIRTTGGPTDHPRQSMPAALEGEQAVETVVLEVAEQPEPVVLILDDLHELRSTDALTQLERLLADLPSSARVVLSSRRDPPIRLHQLRLADELAEIRAGDLRFTERETVELFKDVAESPLAQVNKEALGWLVAWAGDQEVRRKEVLPCLKKGIALPGGDAIPFITGSTTVSAIAAATAASTALPP